MRYLWVETGAGIPYWFDINTHWTHWVETVPTPVPVAIDIIAPEKLRSIERPEVYEQENGIGSYPGAASSGQSPTASASRMLASAAPSPTELRTTVLRHIDSSATLENVRREDDRYLLTLQATRTIESLREDAAFSDVQDHAIITSGSQNNFATISLQRRQ